MIGNVSITTADGKTLSASSDLALAWLWAEHEHGEQWGTLTYGEQCSSVADALAELRRALKASSSDGESL